MTAPARPDSARPEAVRRYRLALLAPVLVVPVGVALAGAAVLLAALPALPDRVLIHWGLEGTTSGSPLIALVAVPITAALAVGVWLMLRRPENVRMGLHMATHGVVMEGGKVRLTGSAEEVRTNPEIAALFLGGHTASAPTS